MTNEYWPTKDITTTTGSALELRYTLAWELLRSFGLVSGHSNREDKTGRAVLDLLSIDATVERAFALADLFVTTAEARGGIKHITDDGIREACKFGGELQKIKSDAEYPRGRWEAGKFMEEALRQK